MAKISFKEIISGQVAEVKNDIDSQAKVLDSFITEIANAFLRELDEVMEKTKKQVLAGDVSDEMLDSVSLKITALLYWASEGQEKLGVRNDLSKSYAKSQYNDFFMKKAKGTVADKTAQAESETLNEYYSHIVFNRAYRMVSQKVEQATEFVQAMKKIISKRMATTALAQIDQHRGGQPERGEPLPRKTRIRPQ